MPLMETHWTIARSYKFCIFGLEDHIYTTAVSLQANGRAAVDTPVPARSPKLSTVGLGVHIAALGGCSRVLRRGRRPSLRCVCCFSGVHTCEMNDAELYSSSHGLQRQLVSAVLSETWPALDWRCQHGTVLDVGCGPGDVTNHELLARLPPGVSVLAVDINPAMLAKAAERFPGPRLRFCQLDIGTPRIEDTTVWRLGPFQKAFSFFCLHWVQNQRLAIKNISKLLCPGGETVLVIVSNSPMYMIFETLAKSSRWGVYMVDYRQFVSPYVHSQDPEGDLRKYLREAGFSVKTCRTEEDVDCCWMDEQTSIDTLTAINPFVGRIPQQLRQAFLQDCVAEAHRNGTIRTRRLASGTTYSLPYDALIAHAVKT